MEKMSFVHDRGEAAITARMYGATYRVNRYGVLGAWVGYDYYTDDGRLVLQSMAACPPPR
jgi:hypothetical protein